MKRIRDIVEQPFCPTNTNVMWLDTSGEKPILKAHVNGTWEASSESGGGNSYIAVSNLDLTEEGQVIIGTTKSEAASFLGCKESDVDAIFNGECDGIYITRKPLPAIQQNIYLQKVMSAGDDSNLATIYSLLYNSANNGNILVQFVYTSGEYGYQSIKLDPPQTQSDLLESDDEKSSYVIGIPTVTLDWNDPQEASYNFINNLEINPSLLRFINENNNTVKILPRVPMTSELESAILEDLSSIQNPDSVCFWGEVFSGNKFDGVIYLYGKYMGENGHWLIRYSNL